VSAQSLFELDALRRQMDAIDRELVNVLSRRASLAASIAVFKNQAKLPLDDFERRRSMITKLLDENSGPLSRSALEILLNCVVDICRHHMDRALRLPDSTSESNP
jgi:chorismate mutase/prephenate dehydratase